MVSVQLVYSSAPVDYNFRTQLSRHLQPLAQKGLISEWHEELIPPGSNTAEEIRRAWRNADILLLLLSADYLASDLFQNNEMVDALERQRLGQLRVVPVLLRPCNWQMSSLQHLQALPRDGKPVTKLDNRNDALLTIVEKLQKLITS